jgi:excinuclease ABC subunit C
MKSQNLKKYKIPEKPGVYFFLKGKSILYIGKATSLRDRTKSYFTKDLIATRGPLILDMTVQANVIKWQTTDSVLEALILEASLIKKYQPKYNTKEKDNKSFNYVCITNEDLPKVLVLRGRNVKKELSSKKYKSIYGPFTSGSALKVAMKIIRRIFPYIDDQSAKKDNVEFYRQLGLVPDITASHNKKNSRALPASGLRRDSDFPYSDSLKSYKKNIVNLKLFFEGKKKRIISNLKKEMLAHAKEKEFEKAGEIKKRMFALGHINDVALIKEDLGSTSQKYSNYSRLTRKWAQAPTHNSYISTSFRIEAYDIAHMSGKNMVGVMTVVENGEPAKSEYKKFNIKTQKKSNDTGALEEVLSRRFRHTEWGMPDIVVVDGSTAQKNVAKRILDRYQLPIPIVAVVKDDKHKARALIGEEEIIKAHKKSIILANAESHRFAIAFHKQKRSRNFLK